MKNANKKGPGRPKYQPRFPKTLKWTMEEWYQANINAKTGEPRCSRLTLSKHRDADMMTPKGNKRPNSKIIKHVGEFRPSKNEKGLGRKQDLYSLREKFEANETKKAANRAKKSNVSVDVGTGQTEAVAA